MCRVRTSSRVFLGMRALSESGVGRGTQIPKQPCITSGAGGGTQILRTALFKVRSHYPAQRTCQTFFHE
jgi:hypothetical protein